MRLFRLNQMTDCFRKLLRRKTRKKKIKGNRKKWVKKIFSDFDVSEHQVVPNWCRIERFLTLCWVRIFWRTLFFRKNSAIWTQRKNFFFRWNFYRHLRKLLIQKVKNVRSLIHFFKVPNPSKRRKQRNTTPRPIRASVKITVKRLLCFVLVIF